MDDPRKVGGTYRSGYWQDTYQVVRRDDNGQGGLTWYTVRWSDGHETTHCTAWDTRRDTIVSS